MKKWVFILGALLLSSCTSRLVIYPTRIHVARSVAVFPAISAIAAQEGYQVESAPEWWTNFESMRQQLLGAGETLWIGFDSTTVIQYLAYPNFHEGPYIHIFARVRRDDNSLFGPEIEQRLEAASDKAKV